MSRLLEGLTAWTRITDPPSGFIVRKSFEEMIPILERIINVLERLTANPNPILGLGGAGTMSVPYPFFILPSVNLFRDGVVPLPAATGILGAPCEIIWCEMVCDPDADPPSADTRFILQNAPTSPTATASITFAAGSRFARAALSLTLGPAERLYVKAPGNLNGLQNLYVIRMMVKAL